MNHVTLLECVAEASRVGWMTQLAKVLVKDDFGAEEQARSRTKHLILLPLLVQFISFLVFRPKIACQAPKPSNPLPTNNIRVAF
jgi:hypothetical protein